MGAAGRQDVFTAMLTVIWLSLACFPGATSTGEPPRGSGISTSQREGTVPLKEACLPGRRRGPGAGAGHWPYCPW